MNLMPETSLVLGHRRECRPGKWTMVDEKDRSPGSFQNWNKDTFLVSTPGRVR